MMRTLPLVLLLALAGCGSCAKKDPPPPPPPAAEAKAERPRVNVERLKKAKLKEIKGIEKLRAKMNMDARQVPASNCAETFPGDPTTKLVQSDAAVAAAPTISPRADRRIPDRVTVTWAPETTIAQANALIAQHKLRVGAFGGKTAFATLCSDGLGGDEKLDQLAAELEKSKLVKSAQVALSGSK